MNEQARRESLLVLVLLLHVLRIEMVRIKVMMLEELRVECLVESRACIERIVRNWHRQGSAELEAEAWGVQVTCDWMLVDGVHAAWRGEGISHGVVAHGLHVEGILIEEAGRQAPLLVGWKTQRCKL